MIFLPLCPNDIILILFSISRPYGEACWKYKMLQAKETPKIAQINFLFLQTNSCDPYMYHYLLPILLQGLVFIKKISGVLHCVFFKISRDRLVGLSLTIVSNPRYVLWRLIETHFSDGVERSRVAGSFWQLLFIIQHNFQGVLKCLQRADAPTESLRLQRDE